MALADVASALRCPHCGAGLRVEDRALRCANRHAFDVARQGYVNLLTGDARAGTADTAAMVAARGAFLDAGHYRPISAAVAEAVSAVAADGVVAEIGSGPAHHLAAALDAAPERAGVAVDVSVHAARRAARAHPRAAAVVADAWHGLPLRDGSAAALLHVFAPRNGAEAARVLAPNGAVIVVTPEAGHLAGLRERVGLLSVGGRKAQRLQDAFGPHLRRACERHIRYELALDRDAARDLAVMGPSGHHLDSGEVAARLADVPEPLRVPVDVRLSVWRRAG